MRLTNTAALPALIGTLVLLISLPQSAFAAEITRTLKRGMQGAEVTTLQQILIQRSLLTGTATGYFGGLTEKAVVAFQKAESISPASGIVGPLTRSRLKTTPSAPAAPVKATSTTATTTAATSTPPKKVVRKNDALLSRFEYIARRDFLARQNLDLLERVRAYHVRQLEVVQSAERICTGSCYTTYSQIDKSLRSSIESSGSGLERERFAVNTLTSYRDRLMTSFGFQEVTPTLLSQPSLTSLNQVASIKNIDAEINSFEKNASAEAFLRKAQSIDANISSLLKKNKSLNKLQDNHEKLKATRVALERAIATATSTQMSVSCTAKNPPNPTYEVVCTSK